MNKVIVLAVITVASLSFTQQRDSIVRIGACATPGAADGVFTQGQYAFIADRGGVTSVDIANPTNPNVLDYLNVPICQATGIFIVDTLCYINSALSGPAFTIINITNPTTMVIISSVIMPVYGGQPAPKGVFIKDSLANLADGSAGFLIIDIADLLNPVILCTLDTPGRVIDLYVRDTLAYLADLSSLLIVNVSDPYNPTVIGSLAISGGGAYDVWVSGDYAFVTEEDFFGGQGKVNMIDISDPTNPTLVKQVSMNATPFGLFVLNNKVYVATDDWWAPVKNKEKDRADIEGGIRVVHWETPDSMSLLVSFDTPGQCRDIFVVDSFIYVAAWDSFMIYKYITTGISENDAEFTSSRTLNVYPNPFSFQTKILFTIPVKSFVSVEIYDASGRRVRDLTGGYFIPGQYQVIWNGKDNRGLEASAGVYYVKLSTRSGVIRSEEKKKIIYLNEIQ